MADTSSTSENKQNKTATAIWSVILFSLVLFVLFLIAAPILWNYYLRLQVTTAEGQAKDYIGVVVVYPPVISAEDHGELVISYNTMNSSIQMVTTTLHFDPKAIILGEAIKNTIVLTDVRPYTVWTYRIPFETTGLKSASSVITNAGFIVVNEISVNSKILTSEAVIRLNYTPNIVRFPTKVRGFRTFLLSVLDTKSLLSITSAITSAIATIVATIFANVNINLSRPAYTNHAIKHIRQGKISPVSKERPIGDGYRIRAKAG